MAAVLLNVESELLSALNLSLRDFFSLILEGEKGWPHAAHMV